MESIPAFLQYGALGLLAVVLVGGGIGAYKLFILVMSAFRDFSKVVAENTEVIRGLKDSTGTSQVLMIEVKDLLLGRPCMREKRD